MVLAIGLGGNVYLKSGLGLFSVFVKYHSLPCIVLHSVFSYMFQCFKNKKIYFNDHFKSSLILSVGFLIFLLMYFNLFNVWIIPPRFSSLQFNLDFSSFLKNFFSYGYYLSAMFFLTIPAFLKSEKIYIKVFLLAVSTLLAVYNQNLGEMDFGVFNQFIGEEVILLVKIFGFWNFLVCCQTFWKDEKSCIMLLTILGYIILLSFTRPVNRYLIFVIPFWAILVCQHISISRYYWWTYVSILLGLNFFATLYQVSNASAAASIANWAVKNNISVVLDGVSRAHIGDFSHYDEYSNYEVRFERNESRELLHKETVSVLGITLGSYVLKKIKNPVLYREKYIYK